MFKRYGRKVLCAALCLVFLMAAASCGGNAGKGQGEEFVVAEQTYKLDKIVKAETSAGTTEYGVEFLTSGNSAPVTFSMGANGGTSNLKSMVNLRLLGEDGTSHQSATIRFNQNDSDAFPGRVRFVFSLPTDEPFPETGEFIYTGDEEETVAISFEGLEAEEDTSTSTSTSTSMPTQLPTATESQ